MPLLSRSRNPTTFPAVSPQFSPSSPCECSEPKATLDYGSKRLVPILKSPPFGAGILAISLFFFIELFSNVLLAQTTLATLGITVTIGTFALLAMVLLILFLF